MKKLVIFLLILTMLLPMCPVTGAEEAEIRPFYMVSWAGPDKSLGIDNVFGMPMFWMSSKIQATEMNISTGGTSDIKEIAKILKKTFDARPEGSRYINFMGARQAFVQFAEEVIFLDKSMEKLKAWTEAFLQEYHAIGGKLDGIILDVEYLEMGYYYFNLHNAEKDLLLMKRIVDDPRYQEVIRPMLEERGFHFWENVSDYTPEIYTISRTHGSKYRNDQLIWDSVMSDLQIDVINKAVYEPMIKYYPDAIVSDYKVKADATWFTGGETVGANAHMAGNSSNDNMYFNKPLASFFSDYNNPVAYNDTLFERSAFNQALTEAVSAKTMYLSTENRKINVWFGAYEYGEDEANKAAANTPYYSEMMYHIGLLDPQPVLGFITHESYEAGKNMEPLYRVASQLLSELTRVVGAADRKPIVLPNNGLNSKFILSGMYAGGRNVWRITPDTSVVSLEDFKVAGDDPTFYVKGQTVTFPGGKIIEDGKIDEIGTCGYWVETATDVYPIITNDADRLEKFPAFKADFESYTPGVFDYTNCYPSKAWDMTWDKDMPAQIVTVDGGQALEFTGNYTIHVARLPQNVTAGDRYAKQQVWEATVTIPQGLSEDAEIYVLKYTDKNFFVEDTGFKIAGGKLYYDREGDSIELCSLSAGTYQFVRKMDLTDLEAPRSSYFVYDTAGKELAKALDVPNLELGAPVHAVGFASVEANGKVLLDDIVLRVDGAHADLFLYDAATGTQIADSTQSRTKDTAYRLSWMNAAKTEATAQVIASVYEGDTLISETVVQTVVMKPGCDDVATGIVTVEDGQSVVVSLKTTGGEEPDPVPDPTDPDATTPDTTDPDATTPDTTDPDSSIMPGKNGPSTTVLIVVIAVIVCAAAAITTVLILKKKAKKD